jgi:hypothetical protein
VRITLMPARRIASSTLVALASSALLTGQVKTNVPEAVNGARSVSVERIIVHGPALEGNLEGNAVDRDVIVFLPPGYPGTHTSDVAIRFQDHVMPFFSRTLAFDQKRLHGGTSTTKGGK